MNVKKCIRSGGRIFKNRRVQKGASLLVGILCLVTFASGGKAQTQNLVSPTRIAEWATGQLLVSDYAAEAVFVIDKESLDTVWTIPIKGKPMGVARFGDLMFVGNEQTESVEVYQIDDARHKARLSFTLSDAVSRRDSGFFQRPTDIAIDPEDALIFILDTGDQLIKVFDVAGNFINTFPPAVTGQPVSFVAAITVDVLRKEILVSDHGNPNVGLPARIVVLTYNGIYQRQINGDGLVDGTGRVSALQFARPQGLVADSAAHLFVVEPVLGKLIIFDQNNVLDPDSVGVVKRLDGLQSCTDLLVDPSSDDVFAVNHNLGRVEVFRGEGRVQ